MTEPRVLTLRAHLLEEVMKDPEFKDRFLQAREFSDLVEVVRDFAKKKGLKFMDIYI